MANIVYIAASIDGYIATEDGGIDWLNDIPNPRQSDYGWSDFINRIDALVMGRKTFEKIFSFDSWPYEKPVFVVSESLSEIPEDLRDKVEIIKGAPEDISSSLKERGFENLYIDGGMTIQRFFAVDLIDELIITRIPILLGQGIPLFSREIGSRNLIHKQTTIYNDCLVKSHYIRNRKDENK